MTTTPTNHVELAIGGMTCASCAARIEKKLNRIDGVEASVNYATERATVRTVDTVGVDDLIQTVAAAGYTAAPHDAHHAAHDHDEIDGLRLRLAVSVLLAIPVVALSMVPAFQFDYWQWVALAFATPVVLWGALPFHRATLVNLRHGATTMDTLVSIGTLAAFAWSLYALVIGDAGAIGMRMKFSLAVERSHGTHEIYLEVAAGVVAFLLTGRYLEANAKRRSGAALRALLDLGAKDASVLRDGVETRVPIDAVVVGDLFVVRPGEKIATDGVVEEGSSAIDAALLTGESAPVEVGVGDAVSGATINVGGRIVVRATRVGSDTALAQIGRLITAAQAGKANVQRIADRVSAVFVPIVLVLAALTLAAWIVAGEGTSAAFTAAVAVLIIACPCALGLATPTALMVGTGRGAQLGIVIRGPEALEATHRIDTVVLDKTGTVTEGRMALVDFLLAPGESETEALEVFGSLEHASEHPIAKAIASGATARGISLRGVEGFTARDGLGVEGVVAGRAAVAGREQFLVDWGVAVPESMRPAVDSARAAGQSVVFGAWDGAFRAAFIVADTIRPSSIDAIRQLRGLGLRPMLVTGDNETVARHIADAVGIDEVVADVLPADKVEIVRGLQAKGRRVAMVGDGVNDAAALAQADLGLAMGSGTDVAIEASDLTLVHADLLSAVDAIRLARATLRTIKGNLFWAFGYNVAAIPLAALGLLNPLIAGAAMAFSSVFVVTNSLRLRRFKGVG